MLSGSAEPECRVGFLVMSPEVRAADQCPIRSLTIPTPPDDAPHTGQTNMAARATIHPTVNDSATAWYWAGSTAVN
jgi:hypothetical protein